MSVAVEVIIAGSNTKRCNGCLNENLEVTYAVLRRLVSLHHTATGICHEEVQYLHVLETFRQFNQSKSPGAVNEMSSSPTCALTGGLLVFYAQSFILA